MAAWQQLFANERAQTVGFNPKGPIDEIVMVLQGVQQRDLDNLDVGEMTLEFLERGIAGGLGARNFLDVSKSRSLGRSERRVLTIVRKLRDLIERKSLG